MRDVTRITVWKAAKDTEARLRTARTEAVEGPTPMFHPSLRWIAGDGYDVAHARDGLDSTRCGAEGRLYLASPGVPLCDECFPVADDKTAFPEQR